MDSKIAYIKRTNESNKDNLGFEYDAMGNRIAKHTYTDNTFTLIEKSTYYVRDASGNVMLVSSWPKCNEGLEITIPQRSIAGSTYQYVAENEENQTSSYELIERGIYDSSRVGLDNEKISLASAATPVDPEDVIYSHVLGAKYYELSNHLGNVLTVISDRKAYVPANGTVAAYFESTIISVTDYSPFGAPLTARTWSSEEYRYSFNGKEKDNESFQGAYDFGARIMDSRLGRWMSVDAYFYKEPDISPFNFCSNSPLYFIDSNGDWKAVWRDNTDHSAGIVFEAEKGDDLKSLAVQLGVSYEQLVDNNFNGKDFSLNNPLNGGEWLRREDLPGLETFQAINDYLKRDDIQMTNCSNTAMSINGISTPNAWQNDSGQFDKEGGNSSEAMNKAAESIGNSFDGVTASEAKIGDVITYELKLMADQELMGYGYNTWDKSKSISNADGSYSEEYINHLKNIQAKYPSTDHYGIVLLKSKEGNQISQIFEKPGVTEPRISNYNNGDGEDFEAAPAPGKNSEIQSKKL